MTVSPVGYLLSALLRPPRCHHRFPLSLRALCSLQYSSGSTMNVEAWILSTSAHLWRWLKAVAKWFFSDRPSFIQLSLQPPDASGASRKGRRGFDPPRGPYNPDSWVRAPKWHGPTGRSTAVAVDEPDDGEAAVAIGAQNFGRPAGIPDPTNTDRRWTCGSFGR